MAEDRRAPATPPRNEQTAEREPVSTDEARQAEIVLNRPRKRWIFGLILGAGVVALFVLAAVLG